MSKVENDRTEKAVNAIVLQTIRVLRDPAKYVRREDERARKLAAKIRQKVNEMADRLLNE